MKSLRNSSRKRKHRKKLPVVTESVEEVSEDAATGDTAIKKGAVPQQKSDLKNSGSEVASNSKEKPEGTENPGAKACCPCDCYQRFHPQD